MKSDWWETSRPLWFPVVSPIPDFGAVLVDDPSERCLVFPHSGSSDLDRLFQRLAVQRHGLDLLSAVHELDPISLRHLGRSPYCVKAPRPEEPNAEPKRSAGGRGGRRPSAIIQTREGGPRLLAG